MLDQSETISPVHFSIEARLDNGKPIHIKLRQYQNSDWRLRVHNRQWIVAPECLLDPIRLGYETTLNLDVSSAARAAYLKELLTKMKQTRAKLIKGEVIKFPKAKVFAIQDMDNVQTSPSGRSAEVVSRHNSMADAEAAAQQEAKIQGHWAEYAGARSTDGKPPGYWGK